MKNPRRHRLRPGSGDRTPRGGLRVEARPRGRAPGEAGLGFAQSGAATVEVESILFPDAPEAPATLVANSEASGTFLQLGAFGSAANAESFRAKIQPQLAELKLAARVVLREQLGIRPLIVVR